MYIDEEKHFFDTIFLKFFIVINPSILIELHNDKKKTWTLPFQNSHDTHSLNAN